MELLYLTFVTSSYFNLSLSVLGSAGELSITFLLLMMIYDDDDIYIENNDSQ